MEDDREAEQEEEEEDDEEYDSGGSGVALTPPESPGTWHRLMDHGHQMDKLLIFCWPGATRRGGLQKKGSLAEGRIDPDVDIYAIPSQGAEDGKEIYFLALVDILTHYGQCLV